MTAKAKHGTPLEERLWARVHKTDTCWLWTGSLSGRDGRGQLKGKDRTVLVHRLSWEIHNGPIPEGLDVLHRCDVPNCVNPDHLFVGTHSDNMKDAFRKGRKSNKGTANPRAKLTEDQVREIRRRYPNEDGAQLAKEFGLDRTGPHQIFTRRRWKHVA